MYRTTEIALLTVVHTSSSYSILDKFKSHWITLHASIESYHYLLQNAEWHNDIMIFNLLIRLFLKTSIYLPSVHISCYVLEIISSITSFFEDVLYDADVKRWPTQCCTQLHTPHPPFLERALLFWESMIEQFHSHVTDMKWNDLSYYHLYF